MVHIDRLRISNLYSYGDISAANSDHDTISFSEVSVIVGPNDSGKSNIFRALKLLVDTLTISSALSDADIFSRLSDPRLEVCIRFSDEEAETLLDFFSVYQLKTQGNIEQTFVHSFKNRMKVADLLKTLRIEVIWQPSNNAALSPICIFYIDGLGLKIYSQAPQATAFVAPEFPFPQGSTPHDRLPQFIESLATENPETANASQLAGSKGWYFPVPPVSGSNLANPTADWMVLDRLFRFAGLSFGPNYGYSISFSQMVAAIFKHAFFLSSGGTIFFRKALQFEESTGTQKTVAQEIIDSTRLPAILEPDGWNLAEYLYGLKNSYLPEERERFGLIQDMFGTLFANLTLDVVILPLSMHRASQQVAPGSNNDFRYPHVVVKDARNSKQFFMDKVGAGISESLFILTALIGLKDSLVLLDEPAVNLHPAQMKALFKMAKQPSNQLVVITHSPTLLRYLLFERDASIIHVRRPVKESVATVLDTKNVWSSTERYRLSYQIDTRIFFARHVLLVEGETDRGFLEAVSDACNMEPDTYEDVIVDAGGKCGLPKYHKLLNYFCVPYTVVADGDNQDESDLRGRAFSYSGNGDYRIIESEVSDDACKHRVFFFKEDVEKFMGNLDPKLYKKVADSVSRRGGKVGKPIFMHEFVHALMIKNPLALAQTINSILECAFDIQNRAAVMKHPKL
ncbi:MAG: AAA family ATPase [Candidatus Bathyarchaeia archaeon]|jgi:ABC-type lipoprotein export system ATPase subunit